MNTGNTGLNMYWDDSGNNQQGEKMPDDVVDLVFKISCKSLPADHAYSLSQELQNLLPWFVEENSGMHMIHIPDAAHGWYRETGPGAVILPSKRTRMILRLPKNRVEEVKKLSGKSLDVAGHTLTIKDAAERLLSDITTILSRYVVTGSKGEDKFTADVINQLSDVGIKPKKLLCGMEKQFLISGRSVITRSVMLADINVEDSIALQQKGLGPFREYGCGLFIPQKDINEL